MHVYSLTFKLSTIYLRSLSRLVTHKTVFCSTSIIGSLCIRCLVIDTVMSYNVDAISHKIISVIIIICVQE